MFSRSSSDVVAVVHTRAASPSYTDTTCTASACTCLAIIAGKRWIAGTCRKIGSRSASATAAGDSEPSRSRNTHGPMNAFGTGTR